jgi:ribosomal protein L32
MIMTLKRITSKSIAPCGLICDLCLGAQRTKNTCLGCNKEGSKPESCKRCIINNCEEKKGNDKQLCYQCSKYPCKRLKALEKRYSTKYGESLFENFERIKTVGIREYVKEADKKWRCKECGEYVCVHRAICLHCGAKNPRYPEKSNKEDVRTDT